MPPARNVATLLCSVVIALACVVLCAVCACVGAFLNRGRGGFVHIGPQQNVSDNVYEEWYWPAHVLSRLLFAIPTGFIVILFGLHLRASAVVIVMTWFSLYVGWGCYMGIGMVDNMNSRSGIFDWVLGRQGYNWTVGHRFVREYAGMSLRGLIWTAPQGYVLERLGFGWEYSLSGNLMGLVYFAGANTNAAWFWNPEFFSKGTAAAEVYWGWWIWFVLCMVCLSQLVRRCRLWVYKKNPYLEIRPLSTWENIKYLSLNRQLLRAAYEFFIGAFNLTLCCSLVFYDLIEQDDVRNKAQTFFGLFTGILLLCFSQGWVWSLLVLKWRLKRLTKKTETLPEPDILQSTTNASYSIRKSLNPSPSFAYRRSPSYLGDVERYEATSAIVDGENQPLLSWPYSHPDRASPTVDRTLLLPEGNPSRHSQHSVHPAPTSTALIILWPSIEKWIWLDVFILIRRLIGFVSLISMAVTLVLTIVALTWDLGSPRFMHNPSSIFILNGTSQDLL